MDSPRPGQGDLSQAADEVHRLKGAAGNLGAVEVFETASKLDEALRAGDDHRRQLSRLNRALEALLTGIEEHLGPAAPERDAG